MEKENNIVLECKNLTKKYGKKLAVNNVSFDLEKGQILGFIGPNGAGKTTTIKLILGLQSITSGCVKINGYDIEKNFEKAILRVGAIVENPDLYMYLTGYENLKLVAGLYDGINKERIDEIVELVGLKNRINDKVSKYSLGMRQRLGIAQAILHKPNLLILDEPTNGLDPEGIIQIRNLLKKLAKKEKMAIFISSHALSELENLCTKICIVKNGKVVSVGNMSKMKEEVLSSRYIFEIDDTSKLNNKKDISITDGTTFEVELEKMEVPIFIKEIINSGIYIYEVKKKEASLEELFLEKTGGNVID